MITDGPDALLAHARERRKIMMRSTCRITRPNTERVFNPDTGEYDTPDRTEVYTGPCQLKAAGSAGPARVAPDVGSAEVITSAVAVIVPWDAPHVETSDAVEILTSDDVHLAGRTCAVLHVGYGDSRTHRLITVAVQDRAPVNDA